MNRWGKWAILPWLGCTAIALILVVQVANSQQTAGMLALAKGVSPEAAADLFEQARPHLEEVLGGRLAIKPHFQVISAEQLQATPQEDLDSFLRWHFPTLEGQTLTRTRQIACQIVGKATVAQYDERGGIILIVPENMRRIAGWDKELAMVDSAAFLQLDLIREVVRWHLDWRFQFATLRAGCRDAEEFDALQAVIEGQTRAVSKAVAVRLGSEAVLPLLDARYLKVPDEAPDASLKTVSQTALHARYRAGIQGMAFFEGLARAGLRDPGGMAFVRLPRQMSVVAQPQLWVRALERKEPDLAEVLLGLESELPQFEWHPTQQTWTPAMLTQVASLLGAPPERAAKIATTWYEGRSLIWTNQNHPDRHVALSVVRHCDEAGARAHFGFALDLERKQQGQPVSTCGPTFCVIESKSTNLQLEGYDDAVRNDKRISFGGGQSIAVSQLLARAGRVVIECTWHGQPSDPALAKRLVQALRMTAD
jgi:hypothetical protein